VRGGVKWKQENKKGKEEGKAGVFNGEELFARKGNSRRSRHDSKSRSQNEKTRGRGKVGRLSARENRELIQALLSKTPWDRSKRE